MNPLPPLLALGALALVSHLPAANPIIADVFTADPAALVHGDTVYLYAGHDEAPPDRPGYVMNEWLCFSSTDMVNWKPHGSPLALKDFAWAERHAWAAHVTERDGKFFWYVTVERPDRKGFAIGVAVSDQPTGPFKDAIGAPLVSSDMTPDPTNPEGVVVVWDDIDPAVFIDDDGQAYLFWGNTNLYWAKLKRNMIELDGPIQRIELPRYVEAPWVHKRNGLYYLSYAWGFPERTAYATAEKITGPWTYRSIIAELAGNCNTNHQSIIEFKGRSYFVYHNGGLLSGGSFRRSACIDYLDYNADGTIRRIVPTLEGVAAADAPRPAVPGLTAAAVDPKTYVLVHGAWAGAWEWKKVGDQLRARGHTVHRPTHTGQGERVHLASPDVDLNTHIQDVVNVIEWENLENIVLLGHSYGGMVITGVADRVPGRIKQVIYLDAFLPEDGESLYTAAGGRPERPSDDGFISLGKAHEEKPIPHVVRQSAKTFRQPISLRNQEAARKLPTTYILTADKASEPEKDGFFSSYERARARGWPAIVMEGDHIVHVTKTEELVNLLEEVTRQAPK